MFLRHIHDKSVARIDIRCDYSRVSVSSSGEIQVSHETKKHTFSTMTPHLGHEVNLPTPSTFVATPLQSSHRKFCTTGTRSPSQHTLSCALLAKPQEMHHAWNHPLSVSAASSPPKVAARVLYRARVLTVGLRRQKGQVSCIRLSSSPGSDFPYYASLCDQYYKRRCAPETYPFPQAPVVNLLLTS